MEECDSHGLPPTEQGRLDLELKIEDTKENMRKAEVSLFVILSQLNTDSKNRISHQMHLKSKLLLKMSHM